MIDNPIYNRQVEIGKRIACERKKLGWSQGRLGEEITTLLGLERKIAQATISYWEKGSSNIELDRILAMSKLFGCDCGYLLYDYDERTHDSSKICESTGLSEGSINCLSFCKTWEFREVANVIDTLLRDWKAVNSDGKRSYKSIIESLYSFFSYSGRGGRYLVTSKGYIVQDKSTDGMVSVGATSIDDTMIENAILVEIQNALMSLKRGMNRG